MTITIPTAIRNNGWGLEMNSDLAALSSENVCSSLATWSKPDSGNLS